MKQMYLERLYRFKNMFFYQFSSSQPTNLYFFVQTEARVSSLFQIEPRK